MATGSFCLVLHCHVPYVLRHGVWPHGEDWLYEAAAETYLPLLGVIDECTFFNAPPHLAVDLTPVLLEQLVHDDFKQGFGKYLLDRADRAREDRKDFESLNNPIMAHQADRWVNWYNGLAERFREIHCDIPRAFAARARAGLIQILTSAATHAYLPLLYEDSSIRAQLRAGLGSSQRILGFRPTGVWLPECGYRPGGPWDPPIPWARKEARIALDRLVADESMTHFFVEHHHGVQADCREVLNSKCARRTGRDGGVSHPEDGCGVLNQPDGTGCNPGDSECVAAFSRDPQICEQVWSGLSGYPANGVYLEFHKKWSPKRGLRYWKVTDKNAGLSDKHLYDPDRVPGKIYEQSQHFCRFLKNRLQQYRSFTGRAGVVTAAFDAELFGHWWFEGPKFLRDVILTLNADEDVELVTAEQFLERHRPNQVVAIPEGSWGKGGDHSVWTNDRTNWMWEIEYRCESAFGKMTSELPWQRDGQIERLLQKAGRELLLLQASDWPFAVSRCQAVDYGIKRFMLHVSRFETLIDLCEKLTEDSAYLGKLNQIERHEIEDADLHDVVFPQIDLNWWNM